jgi:hypothetical protein
VQDLPDFLTPSEVAGILRVSIDTVYRTFSGRPGVLNLGRPERLHQRKYSVLRISRAALNDFIAEHDGR